MNNPFYVVGQHFISDQILRSQYIKFVNLINSHKSKGFTLYLQLLAIFLH